MFWSGGHEQGTLIGFPLASLTAPSQSPVPVGLTPEWNPRDGARAATWLLSDVGAAGGGRSRRLERDRTANVFVLITDFVKGD